MLDIHCLEPMIGVALFQHTAFAQIEDSETELAYPIALMCINGISLITANVYAYLSRRIKTEYSESRYIAIIMSSLLQTSLIFFPVAFLMRTNPRATFIVLTLFIFICMN